MFEKIKHSIGLKQLRKEFKNFRRTGKVINLEQAQSVALLYRVDDEHKWQLVKKYVKYLKEEEGIRKILTIGFFPGKELPEYLRPQLEFEFICMKDLAWNEKPVGNVSKNFCSEYFDILIDLEPEEIIPLRYILNWSNARFKVGYFTNDYSNYYDLMLQLERKELSEYINQVNHYLSIINKVS